MRGVLGLTRSFHSGKMLKKNQNPRTPKISKNPKINLKNQKKTQNLMKFVLT
jgi:hypothetical protein